MIGEVTMEFVFITPTMGARHAPHKFRARNDDLGQSIANPNNKVWGSFGTQNAQTLQRPWLGEDN